MSVLRRVFAAVLLTAALLALTPVPQAAAEENVENGDYKLLALTFDDGPSQYTETLLDGLKERGAYCTFFMVGYMAARYPALLRRMADEGHQLANHSYDHATLTLANVEKELEGCRQYLQAATEEDTYYVRPPYGTLYKGVDQALNAPAILWSVDPNDWKTNSAEAVVQHVVTKAKDGDIILLHDSHKHSVEAGLEIIDQLQAQGYEFVTVRELLRRRGVTVENGKKYYYARNNGVNLPPAAPEYYDEKKLDQHWAWDAIQYVLGQGYFIGTDTGKFLPEHRMTRGMFLTVLGRAAGVMPTPVGYMPYADVPPDFYAEPYVRWMLEWGVLPPVEEGALLKPDESISREEIAGLLYRLYAVNGRDVTVPVWYSMDYADAASISPAALEAVRWCSYAGVFQGDGTGFHPAETGTRAQAATLLMRLDRLLGKLQPPAQAAAQLSRTEQTAEQKQAAEPEQTTQPEQTAQPDENPENGQIPENGQVPEAGQLPEPYLTSEEARTPEGEQMPTEEAQPPEGEQTPEPVQPPEA